jgi:hypothetical protein
MIQGVMQILDGLLSGLKMVCGTFPDKRGGGAATYSMADIGLSAFAPFFAQSESFLSHQRQLEEGHGTSNCRTLFGMAKIPSDNHIRSMLDPVHPSHLQPCFDAVVATLRKNGGMKEFHRLGERTLIGLDGTEYFCSYNISCPHCSTRKRTNGKTENYHAMLSASIVAPGHTMVVPLMPEFISPQDGAEKQDCERNAAKRWLAAHASRVADLHPIYLGDALFACQPLVQAVLQAGADFIFVCKQDGHKTLYDFIDGATLDEHILIERRPGNKRLTYHYRWIEDVPLRDGEDGLRVNWVGVTITDAKGKKTYDGAFVTSLSIGTHNIAELVACARARWKIENETFNVLKNNGYHLEHNFGHGNQYLAMMFAAMNLLAFAFHTVCDCLEELWQKARNAKGSRKRFFQHIQTITVYIVFPSWQALCKTLISCKPPPDLKKNPLA